MRNFLVRLELKILALLLVFATTPAWGADTFYCSAVSPSQPKMYFSDVFTVTGGTSLQTIQNAFAAFVDNRHNDPVDGRAYCFSQTDIHEGEAAKNRDEHKYKDSRTIIETYWKY